MMDTTIYTADLREELRRKLDALHVAALRVYEKDTLLDPDISLRRVAETVLYSFDAHNRPRVAAELDMTEEQLIVLLLGFTLGWEMRPVKAAPAQWYPLGS
jgi:hypothetical protein